MLKSNVCHRCFQSVNGQDIWSSALLILLPKDMYSLSHKNCHTYYQIKLSYTKGKKFTKGIFHNFVDNFASHFGTFQRQFQRAGNMLLQDKSKYYDKDNFGWTHCTKNSEYVCIL